jgi:hypothetical protein
LLFSDEPLLQNLSANADNLLLSVGCLLVLFLLQRDASELEDQWKLMAAKARRRLSHLFSQAHEVAHRSSDRRSGRLGDEEIQAKVTEFGVLFPSLFV